MRVVQDPGIESKTVEALRRHLFGHARYPSWQSSFERLLVGLEVEYLIARQDDDRSLMRREDFEAFLVLLMQRHGFNRDYSNGQPGRVSKDIAPGYIVIEPDFAYHVLEIAWPPRSDSESLCGLVESTLAAVDEALASLGFKRLPTGVLAEPRGIAFDPVNLDRLSGFVDGLKGAADLRRCREPLFLPNFGAFLAATHVHLNAADAPSSLAALPALYEIEWLAQALFSRGRLFQGRECGNARALIYVATFPESYELVHVPARIPSSLEELAASYGRCMPRLFPQEPVLGVKDMSAIRAKSFGTFEFRSACSMMTVKELLEVAAFRVAQLVYGERFRDSILSGEAGWQRSAAMTVARLERPGAGLQRSMHASAERFVEVVKALPVDWQQWLPDINGIDVSGRTQALESVHA